MAAVQRVDVHEHRYLLGQTEKGVGYGQVVVHAVAVGCEHWAREFELLHQRRRLCAIAKHPQAIGGDFLADIAGKDGLRQGFLLQIEDLVE